MPIPKPIRPVCEKCKNSGDHLMKLDHGRWVEPFVVKDGEWVCVFCHYLGREQRGKHHD